MQAGVIRKLKDNLTTIRKKNTALQLQHSAVLEENLEYKRLCGPDVTTILESLQKQRVALRYEHEERRRLITMLNDCQKDFYVGAQRHSREKSHLMEQIVHYLCWVCRRRRPIKMLLPCCHLFCGGCVPEDAVAACRSCRQAAASVIVLANWPIDVETN